MNRKKDKKNTTDIYVITFKINQRDLKTKHGQINKQGGGDNGESKTKEHRKTTDDVAGPHVTDMQEGKKKKKNVRNLHARRSITRGFLYTRCTWIKHNTINEHSVIIIHR